VLRQLRLPFTIDPARLDESYLPGETPGAHVERLALEKARAVAPAHPGALVVGGDTVVVHQGRVLGKPADPEEARAMLSSLAGRSHDVLSGLALVGGRVERSTVARARVTFRAADERALEAYVATGESMDKAGAYGIQEAGAALVEEIRGDYYTVVGFPVAAFLDLLAQAGIRYTFTGLEPLDDP
jgi:septum formation protein